jgi:hypothetical protein
VVANTETIAEADANTGGVFGHFDQMIDNQPHNQLLRSGASVCDDGYGLHYGALVHNLGLAPRTDVSKWSIVERIGVVSLVVVAVATVIALLFSYEGGLGDSVLPPSSAFALHGGRLVAEKFPAIGSAMIDDKSTAAAASARPAPFSEAQNESQQPLRSAFVPSSQSVLNAQATSESAAKEPTPPIPSASDTSQTTKAASIAVPSSAPAPSDQAVPLATDETLRLIKRGQEFLTAGDFAAARLLFKRAADAGSAEAALALGSTYDPSTIKQLGAVSVTPDIPDAIEWYQIAADRGSAEAADQYARLLRARCNKGLPIEATSCAQSSGE